jgi:triosephosphate isomerase
MEKVLREQCAPLFTQAPESLDGFIVAYEPVWAIGTGLTATAAQAQEAQALVRQIFAEHWGEGAAAMLPILYGGSVKPDNAAQLLAGEDVDGLLIGGASLDAASFLAIAAAAEEC